MKDHASLNFFLYLIIFYVGFKVYKYMNRKKMICKSCLNEDFPKAEDKGSIFIELVLYLCLFVPGVIYSIWRSTNRKNQCKHCDSLELIPLGSPMAKKIKGDGAQSIAPSA